MESNNNSNWYFWNIHSLYSSQYSCIGISSNTCAVHQQTLTPFKLVTICSYLLTFLNVVLIYRVKSTSLGYINNVNPLTSNSHSLSNISVFTKVHRTGFGSCWPKDLVKEVNNSLYSFQNNVAYKALYIVQMSLNWISNVFFFIKISFNHCIKYCRFLDFYNCYLLKKEDV